MWSQVFNYLFDVLKHLNYNEIWAFKIKDIYTLITQLKAYGCGV
jgi:hypothetical protein